MYRMLALPLRHLKLAAGLVLVLVALLWFSWTVAPPSLSLLPGPVQVSGTAGTKIPLTVYVSSQPAQDVRIALRTNGHFAAFVDSPDLASVGDLSRPLAITTEITSSLTDNGTFDVDMTVSATECRHFLGLFCLRKRNGTVHTRLSWTLSAPNSYDIPTTDDYGASRNRYINADGTGNVKDGISVILNSDVTRTQADTAIRQLASETGAVITSAWPDHLGFALAIPGADSARLNNAIALIKTDPRVGYVHQELNIPLHSDANP